MLAGNASLQQQVNDAHKKAERFKVCIVLPSVVLKLTLKSESEHKH